MVEQALKLGQTQLLISGCRQITVMLGADKERYTGWLCEALACIQNVKKLFLASIDAEYNEVMGMALAPFDVRFWDQEHGTQMESALEETFAPFAKVVQVSSQELAKQYQGSLGIARHFAKMNISVEEVWVRTVRTLRERRTRMDIKVLHRAIQSLLAVSQSTGDVESCFSYVQMMASERRGSITTEHLKSSLKVARSNSSLEIGNQSIQGMRVSTLSCVLSHHRRDVAWVGLLLLDLTWSCLGLSCSNLVLS